MDEAIDIAGPTASAVQTCSKLTRDYYAFLQSVDPLERWEDLRPLPTLIETGKDYSTLIEREQVLRDFYPTLVHHATVAQQYGEMARRLGFRYAWTRFFMNTAMLEVLDKYLSAKKPGLIIEPGCFCTGLMHFLPEKWGIKYLGIDVSPAALDVARVLANQTGSGKSLNLISGNFLQLTTTQTEEIVGQPLSGTVVLLSNFFSAVRHDWQMFPCLMEGDCWPAYCALIAYWVNAGAIVLMNERHDDPQMIADSILHFGSPIAEGIKCDLVTEYETYITTNMTVENPLGEWRQMKASVVMAWASR
jgi:hypothetical protein